MKTWCSNCSDPCSVDGVICAKCGEEDLRNLEQKNERIAELEAELSYAKELSRQMICAWCGHVSEKGTTREENGKDAVSAEVNE